MAGKAGKAKIDEPKYKITKQMIESGAFKGTQIQKMVGLSSATFYRIKSSKDYEDYRAQTLAVSELAKKRQSEKAQKYQEIRDVYMNAVDTVSTGDEPLEHKEINPNFNEVLLEQILDELKKINTKLSQLPVMQQLQETEEEEEQPTKRGFFGFGSKPF